MEKSYKLPFYSDDYTEIISSLSSKIEQKDSYTEKHCKRVSELGVLLGKKLNLSEEDLFKLKIGGLFHDIGKINVPDSILKKPDKLTNEEYSEIKKHTISYSNLLPDSILFKNVLPIIEHHHEKFDGTGYPSNLNGNNIPYLARITSIVDTYDAITTKRLYNTVLSREDVVKELERCLGTQFDPEIGKVFIDMLNDSNDYNEIINIQNNNK